MEKPHPPASQRTEILPVDDHAPFLRAPEKIRSVFLVTTAAASLPLGAGIIIFGWRAAMVAFVSIVSCVLIERLYFRVTHSPALLGRTHAYLTGVLLALTLPAFTPWYVVVLASVFAILIGKAVFGGVGHFLWQPALVGRFAVAVITPVLVSQSVLRPNLWPVLSQENIFLGDVKNVRADKDYRGWRGRPAPREADGFALPHPSATLGKLTRGGTPPGYSALASVREEIPNRKPTALTRMPPISDLLLGTRPGGIGETCAVVIIAAGLYLVYRNYVKWQLPFAFLASAAIVAAVAPVRLAGPNNTIEWVWIPLLSEGLDVGFTYVNYQLLSGAMLLAAFFLATEMTSCPVTTGGQVIFGVGCGVVAMLLKLYLNTPIPAYLAVLGMNTFTPTIDAIWRPRVFGQKRLRWLSKFSR